MIIGLIVCYNSGQFERVEVQLSDKDIENAKKWQLSYHDAAVWKLRQKVVKWDEIFMVL